VKSVLQSSKNNNTFEIIHYNKVGATDEGLYEDVIIYLSLQTSFYLIWLDKRQFFNKYWLDWLPLNLHPTVDASLILSPVTIEECDQVINELKQSRQISIKY